MTEKSTAKSKTKKLWIYKKSFYIQRLSHYCSVTKGGNKPLLFCFQGR